MRPSRLKEILNHRVGVFLAGSGLSDIEKIQPGHIPVAGRKAPTHRNRPKRQRRLHVELRLALNAGLCRKGHGVAQNAWHAQQVLGYGVVLTILRLFADGLPDRRPVPYGLAVFLGRARGQRTQLQHVRRRLYRRRGVAHVLVLAKHLKGIEAVRWVKRIARVVAVSAPVVKQNDARNAARAVRAEPACPVTAVTSLLQGRGDGNGIVVCPDDACPLSADFSALGSGRAKLRRSDPRANAHHLRAKPIPLAPHHQKLIGNLRRAVPISPGPGVRIARVRVNRGR